MFAGRTILITGGTGSFGKTFLRSLMRQPFGEIRIFSRDEEKQDALRGEVGNANVRFYIGDIRDPDSIAYAMQGTDFVFHAAALKQVPSCEFFPIEAVRTNVLGSGNVLTAAINCGVSRVVCLSTDKAVLPVNAMGMTKGLMEKIALSKARTAEAGDTVISCVRYGNVMYSRGSVIPRFIAQIKQGQPLTITDPNMTRFLMPLSDSVRLVKFALAKSNSGEIFIKKAPASTIETLVKALLSLFEADNEVRVIGPRHGEKLYETLVSAEELSRCEDMGDFYRVSLDDRDLNYDRYFDVGEPGQMKVEDYHSHNTERLDLAGTKELLLSLAEVRTELGLS